MSEKRSDTLIHNTHKAQEQFDYFFSGVISATVAYLAKDITPQKLDSISFDVLLASFVLLLLAMLFAFKRIEATIVHRGLNGQLLGVLESRGGLTKSLGEMRNGGAGD